MPKHNNYNYYSYMPMPHYMFRGCGPRRRPRRTFEKYHPVYEAAYQKIMEKCGSNKMFLQPCLRLGESILRKLYETIPEFYISLEINELTRLGRMMTENRCIIPQIETIVDKMCDDFNRIFSSIPALID